MIKKFQKLQGKRDLWTVYNDFLMFAAICISNSVDIVNRTQREKQFLEVEKRYTKEEMKIFGELLGALTVALNKPGDVLGELLMELDSKSWRRTFMKAMASLRNFDPGGLKPRSRCSTKTTISPSLGLGRSSPNPVRQPITF